MKYIVFFLYLIYSSIATCGDLPQIAINGEVLHPVSQTYLQNIFTRKTLKHSNGQNITVFIKPMNSLEHKQFVNIWLGMSISRYKQELTANLVTNQLSVIEVHSDEEMALKLRRVPGSIGYFSYGIAVNSNDSIKIINFGEIFLTF